MFKRFMILAIVAAFVLPSMGCGFRRGCSKCNVRAEALPPSQYCPAPCQ